MGRWGNINIPFNVGKTTGDSSFYHVFLFFFRQVVIIKGIMVDKLWSMMVNDG